MSTGQRWLRPTDGGSFLEQADRDLAAIEAALRPVTLRDGSAIRVLAVGNGPAVVFVPMVAELNFVYAPQIEAVSATHTAVLHVPRLSRSHHVGIGDRARELRDLLDALGIAAAHLVAWSDTGSPAYEFARRWPGRTLSLTLFGLADEYRLPQPLQVGLELLGRAPVERLVPRPALAAVLAWYLGGPRAHRRWVFARARRIHQLPRLFKHSVLPNLLDHRPRAGEVTVPAMVLCGDRDALVSVPQMRRMAALLDADFVLVPDGEHFLGYIDAAVVNEELLRFLGRSAGRPVRS